MGDVPAQAASIAAISSGNETRNTRLSPVLVIMFLPAAIIRVPEKISLGLINRLTHGDKDFIGAGPALRVPNPDARIDRPSPRTPASA